MLLVREKNEGIWTKQFYRGAAIELKIRPADPDVFTDIRQKHTSTEYAKDANGQVVQVKATDNGKVMDDTLDYLIEDFKGIGYAKDKPWPVDRAHKLKLCFLAPLGNEPRLWEFILAKANEYRTLTEAEANELEKNS